MYYSKINYNSYLRVFVCRITLNTFPKIYSYYNEEKNNEKNKNLYFPAKASLSSIPPKTFNPKHYVVNGQSIISGFNRCE